MENKRMMLDGIWELSFTHPVTGERVIGKGEVPGNVEPALVSMGLLGDYLPPDDLRATEAFEAVDDWCYTRIFDAPAVEAGSKLVLVFEGIDTVAEVYLNGERLLSCQNMHLPYRADVTDLLKSKGNELRVVIRSAELWARQWEHDASIVRHSVPSFYHSQAYLRKARHQWGWDNAPRLLTAGIVCSVYIEELPPIRFEDVYLYTEGANGTDVSYSASWRFTTPDKSLRGYAVRFSLIDREQTVHSDTWDAWFVQGTVRSRVPRDRVRLWWPAGLGNAYLYTARVELLKNGEVVALYERPFGIRTVHLERSENILSDGTGEFSFIVNGERVYIKGTNWKPLDPLASLAHKKTKTEEALRELKNLHCNMVRIWGGGIYEDHTFFDYCDRNGILVWQDFMQACEFPPTDDRYCENLKAEAIAIVKKLRNHPSLALWCGDNENDEMTSWTVYSSYLLPSHSRPTREILKNAVLRHDPFRGYMESSPYVSDINYRTRYLHDQYQQPEKHFYPDIFKGAEELRRIRSLFLGETGPIILNTASPNPRMYARELARATRLWDTPQICGTDVHQADSYFTAWRQKGREACLAYYGRDYSIREWQEYLLGINLVCAEIFKDLIEYCRATRPRKTGVLWWSLFDMWPMLFNYSVIDCDGVRKLPYYWIERSQQDLALMAVREDLDAAPALYVANDTGVTHRVRYTVERVNEDLTRKVLTEGEITAEKNCSERLCDLEDTDAPALLLIKWKHEAQSGSNHFFLKRSKSPDVMREWGRIIAHECEFPEMPLELQ